MRYSPRGLVDGLVRPARDAFSVNLGAEVIVAVVCAKPAATWCDGDASVRLTLSGMAEEEFQRKGAKAQRRKKQFYAFLRLCALGVFALKSLFAREADPWQDF